MRYSLPTQIGKGRAKSLTPELLINLYPERAPDNSRGPFVAHGTPGFSLFANIGSDKIRGMYRTLNGSNLYVVMKQTLYSINSLGNKTSLGNISGSQRVFFAESPNEIVITSDAQSYTYSPGEGLELISDSDFPGASSVTYQDGYFIFNNRQNGQKDQFFISSLLDGQVYDALDFATAENYPDNLVRIFADHSNLLLFGTDSIEIWFNSGVADFPFAPAQGSVIDQGLGAKYSVEKIDESVMWLDDEGIVRRLEGNIPIRKSTHAIEYLISLGDWTNAYSWSYTQEGHQFYVLTVPAANATQTAGTYVYDAATNLWHQRKSYELDYCRIGFHAYVFNKRIVADSITGLLYELSLDIYQENGNHLISEMHFPQLQNDGNRFIVHNFRLDLETGLGLDDARYQYINVDAKDFGDGPVNAGVVTVNTNDQISVEKPGNDPLLTWAGWSPWSADDSTSPTPPPVVGQTWTNLFRVVGGNEQYFNNTTLYIPGTGSQGSTTIEDGLDHAITLAGNTSIEAGDSDFPNGGIDFDGTNDYMSLDEDNNEFSMDGDFTVEFKYKPTARTNTSPTIFSTYNAFGANGGLGILDRGAAAPTKFAVSFNGTFPFLESTTVVANGTFYDIAVTRSGSTWYLFINGTLEDTATSALDVEIVGGKIWIGASGHSLSTSEINGILGYVRVTKGVARYTASYTPASSFPVVDYLYTAPIDTNYQLNENAALVEIQNILPKVFSGYTYYGFYNWDNNPDDNRNGLSLKIIQGSTNLSSNGPLAMLRISSDTRTTGLLEPTRSMGKVGEYSKRVEWRRLGQYESFTPIVRISDPVKRAIFAAYVEVEPCVG